MSQVTVFKCDQTGKLFEDKTKYQKHLKKLATGRRALRPVTAAANELAAWWDNLRATEMELDDLKQVLIENQNRLWADSRASLDTWYQHDWSQVGVRTVKGVVMPVPELVTFTKFELWWCDEVSNSHSSPRNGVRNWGGEPGKPTGYPGWHGRLSWKTRLPREFNHFGLGSGLFAGKNCCINTHSGGSGTDSEGFYVSAYDVTVFADDWPGLLKRHEKFQSCEKLLRLLSE